MKTEGKTDGASIVHVIKEKKGGYNHFLISYSCLYGLLKHLN